VSKGTASYATSADERISRRQVDKFAQRRDQLAEAALTTLSELGYARTSLREIAQHSAFSHGVLHYYFSDKVDLITHCVRQYKAHCVTRYDRIVADARTPQELEAGFNQGLAETLRDEAKMHRLWYDLRSQALFESTYRADVAEIDASLERMIWRIVSRYAELSGSALTITSPVMYAVFDGLFQQSLLRYLSDDDTAIPALQSGVSQVLAKVVG
jgi:AcrR family transcriptional regulator